MTAFSKSLEEACAVIKQGGVIVCPAEGVYGLSCNALNEDAVKRVIAIKERDSAKGLIVVGDTNERLSEICDFARAGQKALGLMRRLWPGPFTFVLPCVKNLEGSVLTGGRGTAAARLTAFETLKELCVLCEAPLVTTSANLSGAEAVSDFALLSPVVLKRCDLALELPCGGLEGPTSIYDAQSCALIRRGRLWPEDLQ